MSDGVARRIIRDHLVAGEVRAGTEIAIRIDQTLTRTEGLDTPTH